MSLCQKGENKNDDAVQLEAVGIREPHVLRHASPATA